MLVWKNLFSCLLGLNKLGKSTVVPRNIPFKKVVHKLNKLYKLEKKLYKRALYYIMLFSKV